MALVSGAIIIDNTVGANASFVEENSSREESDNRFLNRFFNQNNDNSNGTIQVEEINEITETNDLEMQEMVNTELLEVEDIQDTSVYSNELEQLLNRDDIDEVLVVDNSLLENKEVLESELAPASPGEITIRNYETKIHSVKNGKDYNGKSAIASAEGSPGITLTISKTKSVGRTYSLSLSTKDITVGKAQINAAVGYNVSKSDSISISGSYKVPQKHKNKKVKTAKLTAHVIYKQKNFKVKKRLIYSSLVKGKWENAGTGYSRKPYGIKFKKTYTYK